ncbi:MAG: hypothetical protein MJ174_00190 [Treponema sp.]|nr:hypothetical protein [Treponema sp.]
MKKIRRFLFALIFPVFVISCSQMQIDFGEIGIRLPYDSKDSSLDYYVTISGVNQNYYKLITGSSGDTFIVDDLDSGKYEIVYNAYDPESGEEVYYGDTTARVYVGIISPVAIELNAVN